MKCQFGTATFTKENLQAEEKEPIDEKESLNEGLSQQKQF